MARLHFLGAIQQVTGSCYLIETDAGKILLECGMVQGEIRPDIAPDKLFQFNPPDIDYVIISHAHLDHSGLLPGLVREGYRGPIFVTTPTYDLLDIMLKDAAFLQQKILNGKINVVCAVARSLSIRFMILMMLSRFSSS